MSGMEDRQKAAEGKFKMDEETKFKIGARRAKLVGLWAADKLGLTGQDAEDYAKLMVSVDLTEAGDADIIAKLKADFENRALDVSDHDINKALAETAEKAKQQIMAAGK